MSSVERLPQPSDVGGSLLAAEVGSACLEGTEPDRDIVALAQSFVVGDLSEAGFSAAVKRHQQALVTVSPQAVSVVGRE